MPAVFESEGIRFQYPENWKLDDSHAETEHSVTVESPDGAFWTVAARPFNISPAEMAEAARQAIQEEYEEVESEEAREQLAGYDLVGFNLRFFFLDLTNTCQIRAVDTPFATYLIYAQGEDRAFEEALPIFDAMKKSLLEAAA